MFIKNAWYVACTPDEIDAKPLGRMICGERIVFYRGEGNKVAALADFCPHRGAALSLGFVNDRGHLVCGYHGLEMNCKGQTVQMPGQRVRGFPQNRSFPVEERYGFIWVWTGQEGQADPNKIPHQVWYENPDWAFGGGLYHIKCDYRLMVDNLMDLTHETYVHSSSIGQSEIDETPCKTIVEGQSVVTSRFMEGVMPPPFWKHALRSHQLADDVKVDRWQICRFSPPSNVMIEVGVAHQGYGGYDAPDSKKVYSIVVDFITPESESSIHYFWGMARKFRSQDKALTAAIRDGQAKIFAEDQEVLERQQENIQANPDRSLLKLNIDMGGVQARKIIDQLIDGEQAAS